MDDVLIGLDIDGLHPIDREIAKVGDIYLGLLKESGRPLVNRITYCFDNLDLGSRRIGCSVGRYYDDLKTCFVLSWELLTHLGKADPEVDVDSISSELVLRNHLSETVNDPVTDPSGRRPSVGIVTTTMFRRGDEAAVLLGVRAAKGVAAEDGLRCPIPGGIFQPMVTSGEEVKLEYSVQHNVFREYLEELFSVPEVKVPVKPISHQYFYRNPNLMFLRGLIDAGEASLTVTGVAVDLLTLRLDILTTLDIKTPRWFRAHEAGGEGVDEIKFNEEWEGVADDPTLGLPVMQAERVLRLGLSPSNALPSGAASLGLALEREGIQAISNVK
ncbi:MAG: hypothetical protein JRM95_04130 [Nitrososphaerota archaeon]|nr:hypothetical protein [Nitrososphaerota archaeon]